MSNLLTSIFERAGIKYTHACIYQIRSTDISGIKWYFPRLMWNLWSHANGTNAAAQGQMALLVHVEYWDKNASIAPTSVSAKTEAPVDTEMPKGLLMWHQVLCFCSRVRM